MRLPLVALLIVLLAPVSGTAQTVTVRSGEHDGFTRLVLDMPGRVEWTLDRSEGGAELRFKRGGLKLDISAVFQRIPRTRVTRLAASEDGTTLSLELGCDCGVTGFWHSASMLVIDVTGKADTGLAQADKGPKPVGPANAGAPLTLPPTRSISAAMAIRGLGPGATTSPAPLQEPQEESLPGPRVSRDLAGLEESRERLLREFGRAATQGLLSPGTTVSNRTDLAGADDAAEEHPQTGKNPKPPEVPQRNPGANIHLRAQSSIDRDFLAQLAGRTDILEGTGCIETRLVNVENWAGTEPLWQQLGPLRAALTSEFDKTDETAALNLARLYVHFGFGAEAQQVLDLLPGTGPEQQALSALAAIMEVGYAPAGSVLEGQLDCDTPAALWSVLSYQSLPPDVLVDEEAVLRAFAGLPRHLRSYTGPILSRRYLEAGRADESEKILRILDRHEETKSADAEFVRAEMELASGETETANARLEQVVAANTEPSAEALALRIDTLVRDGQEVSYDLAQLAGAYAHEHRDDATGPAMAQAHALALAASGAFDQAYRELDALDPVHAENSARTRARIADLLVSRAEDPEFLRHALSGRIGAAPGLPPATALLTARRLFDAGFPGRALPYLDTRAEGPVARDMRMLRAEISLELGRPRQAEVDLLGLSGEDVNLLRARARSMVGEHGQAQDLYRSAGLTEEAEREAWLAQDWPRLSQEASPERAAVANLRMEAGDDTDRTGVLARNRVILDEAGKTRAALEALLSASPLPAVGEN